MTYDMLLPVFGDDLPLDHAYVLYAALSHKWPGFHDPATRTRFAPITGTRSEPGRLTLTPHSRLWIRASDQVLPAVLALVGQSIQVGGAHIALGPPTVIPLKPTPSLLAKIVTFKNCDQPERFLETAKTKLAALRIDGEPEIAVVETGPRSGELARRVVRIKGKSIVGYTLLVCGLSAEHSILLQEQGLGGRTRMGCGFFRPARS